MSVTKHARRRSKQRNGFTKGTVEKMSSRAWANGLPRDVIGGELREVLDRFRGKFVRYYINTVYIFNSNGTLITMMDIDPKYEKNLLDYVDYRTFVKYKTNRFKHKRSKDELEAVLSDARVTTMKKLNDTVFAEEIFSVIHLDPTTEGNIIIYTNVPGTALIDLQEEYKSKKFLIRPVEQYQTKITNWFKQNFFLKVTAEYTENDTVIVKIVRHTRDNKFYSLTFLAEEFKKYFKKEVWIEP